MKGRILAAVRYWWSIAVGGVGGALTSYLQQQGIQINFDHLDWHKISVVAIYGAITAVAFHMKQPPNSNPS